IDRNAQWEPKASTRGDDRLSSGHRVHRDDLAGTAEERAVVCEIYLSRGVHSETARIVEEPAERHGRLATRARINPTNSTLPPARGTHHCRRKECFPRAPGRCRRDL